jgi:hypothetical protein
MAASNYTPIQLYSSPTPSATPVPANLAAGELAINTADGKLFYKDSGGAVQVIGTKGGVGASSTTQVMYNSSGLIAGSANMTFNGTYLTASMSGSTISNYETFTATTAPTYTEGRVWYDSAAHALSYYNDSSTATVHVGQDLQLKVINNTGSSIPNGSPVYITGTSSGQTYPNIALAKADAASTAAVIGLTNGAIANGAIGYVTAFGGIDNVNTSAFSVSQILYLSPFSAGQLQNTVPVTGLVVQVGTVTYVNSSTGKINVKQNTPLNTPIANGGTGATTAPAAMANLMGFTTTATAAGTTTLTSSSSFYQIFTGSTTQAITLPLTSTLALGWTFHICNNSSTGNLTVNASAGINPVITIPPGTTAVCTCISTSGITAASWEAGLTDFSTYTGTGNLVLSNSPTLVTPALGTPASGTVTNLTGTASININGTVGATTANSGAFTTLSSTSDATINGLTVGLGAGAASGNTTVGNAALLINTTGQNNTAIGNGTLNSNTSGLNNTAVGAGAANYNINGTDNTAIGASAFGSTDTGSYNTAVGSGAINSLSSTATYNCALGYAALGGAFTTSNYNTAIGIRTFQYLSTGDYNTAVGSDAANGNNISTVTGNNNTAIGASALYNYTSGSTNTVLGSNSGYDITSGSNNVILGGYTGLAAPISATGSNWIVLSDGAGNVRQVIDSAGNAMFGTGNVLVYTPTPASISSGASPLTNANLQTQIINTTGTTYTLTLPTGTTLNTLVTWYKVDLGFDFSVINTASGTVTLGLNTGVTNLGSLAVATGTSARFRIRRTAASTYVVYRLS